MQFRDAQPYIGKTCEVEWQDRHGSTHTETVYVVDVSFVPLYGICLITDQQEIRLDRVLGIRALEAQAEVA